MVKNCSAMAEIELDWNFDRSYIIISCTSFIACFLVYKHVCPALSKLVTKKYEPFDDVTKNAWNLRLVSSIHAVIATVLSALAITEPELSASPLHATRLSRLSISITFGYLSYDILMVICTPQNLKLAEIWEFIVHHIILLSSGFYIMSYGILGYFAMWFQIGEFSTPALNQKWFYEQLRYPRDSVPYLVTGIAFSVTFFVSRILTMPNLLYTIWMYTNTPTAWTLGKLLYLMYPVVLIFDLLNLYWFYKICRGLYKALVVIPRSKRDQEIKTD